MAGYCALGLGKVDLAGVLDLMEGRKLEGMIMVELDSGGQMPYTPREAAEIAPEVPRHARRDDEGVTSYATQRVYQRPQVAPRHTTGQAASARL